MLLLLLLFFLLSLEIELSLSHLKLLMIAKYCSRDFLTLSWQLLSPALLLDRCDLFRVDFLRPSVKRVF